MQLSRRAILGFALLGFGCSHRMGSNDLQHGQGRQAQALTTPAQRRAGTSPALVGEDQALLGWLIVGSIDRSLQSIIDYARQQDEPPVSLDQIKKIVAKRLGYGEAIVEAVDGSKPIAVAFLDPRQYQRFPVLMGIPLRSPPAFLAALERTHARAPMLASGIQSFEGPIAGRFYVSFSPAPRATPKTGHVPTMAFIAPEQQLLDVAPIVLAPLMSKSAPTLVAHLSLTGMRQSRMSSLESFTSELRSLATSNDLRSRQSTRVLSRVGENLVHASTLELQAVVARSGLRVRVSLEGPSPRWISYVGELQTGPCWAAEIVPADSMLVYSTHLSADGLRREAENMVSFLASLGHGSTAARPALEKTWMNAITALHHLLKSDAIYAVWPASPTGIGVGGAYRTSGGTEPRSRMLEAYKSLESVLGMAAAHQLGLDPSVFRFQASIRAGENLGGATVDLLELDPQWPADSAAERSLFEWLFGKHLTLAFAFVGEHALYASGQDWRPRLSTMIATIQRNQGDRRDLAEHRSILNESAFVRAEAMNRYGRVSFAYVRTALLARFVTDVLESRTTLSPGQWAMLRPFVVPEAEHATLVTMTNVEQRNGSATYRITLAVPLMTMAELGHLGEAMLRVGVSPIIGPPLIPPLPTPPASITPPPRPADPDRSKHPPTPASTARR
ncbi:MAG: hypothetical protein V2A73_07630 [Pseudomonadota bacterium]